MSLREKMILGIMAVALIWGGYSIFFTGDGNETNAVVETQPEMLTEITAQLKSEMDNEKADLKNVPYIFEHAAADWQKDPFADRAIVQNLENEALKRGPEVSAKELGVFYTGYLAAGTKILAVINGLEYEEGERLETRRDLIVKNISPKRVIIIRDGTLQEITVPIEETDF